MHWGVTFSSFPAHEYGKYAEKKILPRMQFATSSHGRLWKRHKSRLRERLCNQISTLFVLFASLASPLSSEFLFYELIGSGQCSGRGVIPHPLWHELYPRGDLKEPFDSSATTGALDFPSCTLSSVYRSSFDDSKTFRSLGGLDPKKPNRSKDWLEKVLRACSAMLLP
jgi:hypothetical protein